MSSKAKAGLRAVEAVGPPSALSALLVAVAIAREHVLGRVRRHLASDRENVLVGFFPFVHASLRLRAFPENQAKQDVETPECEDEERGHEREFVNMVGEHRRAEETLDYAQRAQAELRSEDGEVRGEELVWPTNFRKDTDNALEDDQKPVEDGPKGTCGLVRDCTTPVAYISILSWESRVGNALDVVTVIHRTIDSSRVA